VESIFQLDNDCNGLEPTLTKVFGQALNTMQPAGSEQDNFGLTVPEVRWSPQRPGMLRVRPGSALTAIGKAEEE
jgi:hypothetical protein